MSDQRFLLAELRWIAVGMTNEHVNNMRRVIGFLGALNPEEFDTMVVAVLPTRREHLMEGRRPFVASAIGWMPAIFPKIKWPETSGMTDYLMMQGEMISDLKAAEMFFGLSSRVASALFHPGGQAEMLGMQPLDAAATPFEMAGRLNHFLSLIET